MMLSTKPYIIRAFYEWILDSECTPFMVVDTNLPRCHVPAEYVEKNGEIVFNVSPESVRDFTVSRDLVEFRATFAGIVRMISFPVKAVLSIYAEENGQGMFFDNEEDEGTSVRGWAEEGSSAIEQTDMYNNDNKKKRPSHLRVVE